MIGDLKPYPMIKESRIEWFGVVPEHWELRRLRHVARVLFSNVDKHSKDDERAVRLCNYSDVYHNDRIRSDMDFMKATATVEEIERFRLSAGDVLITKDSESWDDIGVPALVESPDHNLVCGYHLALLRPISGRMNGEFLHRALASPGVADQFFIRANGVTRFGLSQTAIKSVWLPAPPLSEQSAIVRFLNHADRRIQRYIRAKEKLIALLEEQKQAIIHQAVTGQIDVRTGQPYPDYKPSGIEWLGDVPTHWQVLRLGRVINLKVGFPFKSDDFTQSEEDMRLLRGINVAPGRLRWDKVVRWPAADVATFSEFGIGVGDIIFGMDRPIIGNGIRVAVASESDVPSLLLQRVACIRPDPESLVREFAFWILSSKSFVNYLSPIFTGISVPHLSPQQIKEFWISVPNIAEQKVIITYLTSRLSAIQSATERTQRQIDLVNECRTRLIADVVTGKLDVRAAAAALLEDTDGEVAAEGDCAGPEGGDGGLTDHGRRTEFPAAQEEMIA